MIKERLRKYQLYKKLRYYKLRLMVIVNLPRYMRMLDKAHREGELRYLSDADLRHWKTMFKKMLLRTYLVKTDLIVQFFATAKIQRLHTGRKPLGGNDIIGLVVVKDSALRLEAFLRHGRRIGIDRFAVLDNGCASEVLDWLKQQDDVDLYHTDDAFQTLAKDGWINRLISLYGRNRWYFQLDSDELPAFLGMETHDLHDVVRGLEQKGYTRARALLLDMYPKDGLFHAYNTPDEMLNDMAYFDSPADSIVDEAHVGMSVKKGGPRYRVFGSKQMLTKCPLYKFGDAEVVIDAHFQWPYEEVNRSPYLFALLHYKYISNDYEEYAARVRKGNFASGSQGYKDFFAAYGDGTLRSFYYEGSCRYEGEASLRQLGFLETVYAEE